MSLLYESFPEPHEKARRAMTEQCLAARIKAGDEAALNELVMRNMREALLYTRGMSRKLSEGDLVSLCYAALIRNAKRFDASRQRFFAFAKPGLRGALYRNYNKEQLPIEQAEAHRVPHATHHKKPASISSDELLRDGVRMQEYEPIADHNIVQPDFESIFTRDRWALVQPLLKQKCSEQEQMVLTLTYVSGFNFQEIGELMDVTRSAIQRTHWRAVKKLRMELGRRKQLFS